MLPSELLLSNLLNHNVKCDDGLDHGQGSLAWMHPPVHRLLGWATKPSSLSLSRDVWRLNQLKLITNEQIYMKGRPAKSDQATLERFPTLIDASLINKSNQKIGIIADFIFETRTGKILYYLVSRSNPRIPGTSRWRLNLDKIIDQQPGLVISNVDHLDDIPIIKSSLRQDFLKNSKKWKQDFKNISFKFNNRLEGWLEESPWYENGKTYNSNLNEYGNFVDSDHFQDDELLDDSYYRYRNQEDRLQSTKLDGDPWI